jgi:hypothetical protein
MDKRNQPEVITDITLLRARIAEGTRQAAAIYRANADLRGASAFAIRLEQRANALDAGAPLHGQKPAA